MVEQNERRGGIAARLQRFYQTTALLVLAILLTTGGVLGMLLLSVQPEIEDRFAARRMLDAAHQGMVDQDAGLRNYLLTGEKDFLENYQRGVFDFQDNHSHLSQELANNPALTQELLDVRLAQQVWTDLWADEVPGMPAVTEEEAGFATVAFLAEGTILFSEYRVEYRELSDDLVLSVDEELDDQRNLIIVALAIEGALFALLLGVGLYQQLRLRQQVVQPMQNLTDTISELRDGNLTARAEKEGPWEMRQLADSLAEMGAALQEAKEEASAREDKVSSQANDLRSLLGFAQEVAGSLSLRHILETLGESVQTAAGTEHARIWLLEEDTATLSLAYDSVEPEGEPKASESMDVGTGVVGRAAQSKKSETHNVAGRQTVCMPLVVGARVVGVVEMRFEEKTSLDSSVISMLETFMAHSGAALEAARLHSYTQELSQVDPLTQLYNRRKMEEDIDNEIQQNRRSGQPLSFVMVDVDHFKRLNDTQGHRVGDEILQQLGQLLKDSLRSTDSVYRYGGEEFSLLLRGTDQKNAASVTENLRDLIEKHFAGRAGTGRITVSCGIAELRKEDPGMDALIKAADEALYVSKRNGRNQVNTRG